MNAIGDLASAAKRLSDLLYPSHAFCVLCGDKRAARSEIDFVCASCREKLRSYARPADICQKCGQRMGRGKHKCRQTQLSGIAFAYPYSYSPARGAVRAVKFHSLPQLAELLAPPVAACCRHFAADVIVPVPLSSKRLSERGYNQSEAIAKAVAALLSLPVDSASLIKVRNTKAQSGLQRKDRQGNVRGAYAVCGNGIAGKRVLLIDDVVTTGSTANACARAMLEAGAKSVCLGAVCGKLYSSNRKASYKRTPK